MGIFGDIFSSDSRTENESSETIFNNAGTGDAINLANLDFGKSRNANLNLHVQQTDHEAIASAFEFAEMSQAGANAALQETAELAQAGIDAAAPAQALSKQLMQGVFLLGAAFAIIHGVKVFKK